jgi:hypothetical protein
LRHEGDLLDRQTDGDFVRMSAPLEGDCDNMLAATAIERTAIESE